MHGHEEAWYQDPTYWVAIGFALFMGIFLRYLAPMITRGLDKRSDAIRNQLEQASKLRSEAEAVLEEFRKRQTELEIEAARIVEEAKQEAIQMRKKASAELEKIIARREAQANTKIALMEKEASQEIRTRMLSIATQAAEQLIKDELKKSGSQTITDHAIKQLEAKFH